METSIDWPSASVTIALFTSLCRPTVPRNRFTLPLRTSVFTLVTLPVEFNASSRAVAALVETNIISQHEAVDTKRVLDAAALTYVAAAISAVLQLVYLLFRAGLFNSRDND